MVITYPFHEDSWTADGPSAVLLAAMKILKLPIGFTTVDFGCGPGVWLQCCKQFGSTRVLGVDGSLVPTNLDLLGPNERVQADLSAGVSLKGQFDLAICTEVAEHLPDSSAIALIDTITRHSSTVIFSAAAPGQAGSGHIHCRWPEFWQALFNERGFACDDGLRWVVWDDAQVEPWYRQNIFIARRSALAGTEVRIKAVVHPDMIRFMGCLQSLEPAAARGMPRWVSALYKFVRQIG